MFCPKCGNQLPDGSKFCGFCGEKMPEKKTKSTNIIVTNNEHYEKCVDVNPAVALGSSNIFLVTIILFTAGILFDIFQSQNNFWGSSIFNALSILTGIDELQILAELLSGYSLGLFGLTGMVAAVVRSLPIIIKAVALWMIYTSCSKGNGNYKTAQNGFKILLAWYVIDLMIKEIIL